MIGNWTWVRQGCRVVDEKHRKVAEVTVSYCDEAELNRRGQAIAAVPEMIAALQMVDRMFSMPGKINKNTVRDEVRAALSRALTPEEK